MCKTVLISWAYHYLDLPHDDIFAVVQAKSIVAAGKMNPETIITPGIFVQRIVKVSEPAIESTLVAAGVTYP